MRPDTYARLSEGTIQVGGVFLAELADRYGTPLYVMDYETLVDRMRRYQTALSQVPSARPYYAGKAFCCRAMVELVDREGFGLDVVSGGELFTAINGGLDAAQVLFHGNVKTRAEIEMGLEVGVGAFVVDSLDELRRIDAIAADMKRLAPVLLRLTPGIDAHTHEFIRTGRFDSKFGFGMVDGIADEAVTLALSLPHVELQGFHAHVGSQILEAEPFLATAAALLEFSRRWFDQVGFWPKVIDLGGGLGVRYQEIDQPPDLGLIVAAIRKQLETYTPTGQRLPKLVLEPGRSIVAEAGFTLYRIEAVKQVQGGKQYVAVDGGMGDNIRPALYQAAYTAQIDRKPDGTAADIVTVAGRYCESGDILMKDVALVDPRVGDLLVVWGTGAYNYSMASNYNRVPRPPVVLVNRGETSVWVEGETWQDLMRLDRPLTTVESVKA